MTFHNVEHLYQYLRISSILPELNGVQKRKFIETIEKATIKDKVAFKDFAGDLTVTSNFIDGCAKCINNKPGVENGLWCATNCIRGSKFELNQ